MAPSFRNRGALSGYIALEVKDFFCAAAQKVEIGWRWLFTSLRGALPQGNRGAQNSTAISGLRARTAPRAGEKTSTNLISLHD
jgi:hypothetical protein